MSYLSVFARSRRREIVGAAAALTSLAVLGAVMFAFRSALGDGVIALVLVVPVVIAAVLAGGRAGVIAAGQDGPRAATAMRPGASAAVVAPRPAGASGSGVGLTIAKAFVEAHGGTISAGNSPGGGARVSFSLPLTAAIGR